MRLVRTEALEAGMLLALPILSSTGALLLREDLVLTERTIALLKKQAVPFVYIRDRRFPDAAEEPLLRPETFRRALKELQDLFVTATAARGDHLPPERMERIQSVLRDILEDVFDRSDRLVLRFLALRGHDGYIFTHIALVATTSLLLGQELSFSYAQLYNLGLGALLHDLGMAAIPSEIVDKKGPLDGEERFLVNLHPRGGWDLLAGHDLVWPTARIVALQHHERWDGSGYPAASGKRKSISSVASSPWRTSTMPSSLRGLTVPAGLPGRPTLSFSKEAARSSIHGWWRPFPASWPPIPWERGFGSQRDTLDSSRPFPPKHHTARG
jgi:hypothetical protein